MYTSPVIPAPPSTLKEPVISLVLTVPGSLNIATTSAASVPPTCILTSFPGSLVPNVRLLPETYR